VGTPPPSSSFKSSTSSLSLNNQQFYSPSKHNSSFSSHLSSFQEVKSAAVQPAPLSSPSLSFSKKKSYPSTTTNNK
jgi:hypothetical protein